jgi:hypothetical protein
MTDAANDGAEQLSPEQQVFLRAARELSQVTAMAWEYVDEQQLDLAIQSYEGIAKTAHMLAQILSGKKRHETGLQLTEEMKRRGISVSTSDE